MAQFLIINMYFLFYKIFLKLPIFSYFGLLKSFLKISYRKKNFLLKRLLYSNIIFVDVGFYPYVFFTNCPLHLHH